MKKRSNKRVATMTFHMAHNFGAMLQAYALEKAINGLGYRCEILHYRFHPIDRWGGIDTFSDLRQRLDLIRGTLSYFSMIRKGFYDRQTPQQKRFNHFMHKHMRLSSKTYFTAEELAKADYDAYVLGSDQIWNTSITDGLAPEYFGAYFTNPDSRLISYAASCGTDRFQPEHQDEILPMLRRFHSISAREEGLTQYLKDTCQIPAQTVLDPVFLLTTQQWDRLLRKSTPLVTEPYLLVYAFDVDDEIYHLARRIAKERNLKPVIVGYKSVPEFPDMLQMTDCGPLEFLSLVRHASFVCTSSFHGQALSILFNRNFYLVAHPKYYQRNIDLLELVGLTDRLIKKESDVKEITDCDFTQSNARLNAAREQSLQYLVNAIDG